MNTSNKEDKRFKRVCMSMCDRKVPCDISNEFTIPDYKPEVRRVLYVNPVVTIPVKYINSATAEFSGNVDYNVLYVGADGELHSIPFTAEYSFETPIESEGFDFNDEITCCCDVSCENTGIRVLGPRKLNIKGRINSRLRLYGRKIIDQEFDSEHSPEILQTLEEKVNNARIVRVDNENIDISDESMISSACQGVTFANANAHVSSARCLKDAVAVDGEVILKMLCVDMEDSSKTTVISKKIPFSTEIDAQGVTPQSKVLVKGYINEMEISVDDDRIICDMSLSLQVEAQDSEEIVLVRDAYSTNNETSCAVKNCEILGVGYTENGNFSMNEKISRDALGLDEEFSIIDIYGSVAVESFEINDSKAELRGVAKYTLIIKAGEDYSSQEISLPVKYVFDCENDNMSSSYNNELNIISCQARCDGDTISIDAEIGVLSVGVSSTDVCIVDEIKLGEKIEKEKGVITIAYPGSDEDLWSVAKRYHVSVSEIEEKNSVNANAQSTYLIV